MNRPPPRPAAFAKPLRPRTVQPVSEVLARSGAFAALRAGVEQLAALETDIKRFLPDYLVANVTPGAIKDGTLTLFTEHGALAARLRHLEPGLLHALQQRGWAVKAMKIRVRPSSMENAPAPKQARVSAAGAACLRALSESLRPSPLQAALACMAARHENQAADRDSVGNVTQDALAKPAPPKS